MIATSSGPSRFTRSFVRRPRRALPCTSSGERAGKRRRGGAAAARVVVLASTVGCGCLGEGGPLWAILRGLEQRLGVTARRQVSRVGPEHAAELRHQLAALQALHPR